MSLNRFSTMLEYMFENMLGHHLPDPGKGKCVVPVEKQPFVTSCDTDAHQTAGSIASRIDPRDPVRSSEQPSLETINKGNQLVNEIDGT